MKYKLLKDLPGYEAGTVFEEKIVDGLYTSFLGGKSVEPWVSEIVANNNDDPDWFEPIPDTPARWRAERHKEYWYVDLKCGSAKGCDQYEAGWAVENYQAGNYFRTREQAEAVAEAFKAVLKTVHNPEWGNNSFWGSGDNVETAIQKAWEAVQEHPHA